MPQGLLGSMFYEDVWDAQAFDLNPNETSFFQELQDGAAESSLERILFDRNHPLGLRSQGTD